MKLVTTLALAILTVSSMAHALPEIQARGGETDEARATRERSDEDAMRALRGDNETGAARVNARNDGETAALGISSMLKSKAFDSCTGACRATLQTIADTVLHPKAHDLSGKSAEEAALLAIDVHTALQKAVSGGKSFDVQAVEDQAIRNRLGISEKEYTDACEGA